MTLEGLAARVEQATGPDRELDYQIAKALGFGKYLPEKFTASLDAAMTLASGFGGEITFFKDGTAKAFLWQPYPMAIEAKAATPALALCAAALRAKEQE